MQCKKCLEGIMEATEVTSFGTGGPVYKCSECGWTYVHVEGIKRVDLNDALYAGMFRQALTN